MKWGIWAGVALAGFVVANPGAAQTVLRFNQALPATHWSFVQIINPWMKSVEEATGGRVKVQSTGASLGGFGQSMDLAAEGVADLTFGTYGLLAGRFTLAKITENPLLGSSDPLAVSLAFWRAYDTHFSRAREHERAGVKLVAHWVSGANHFYTREREVKTVADLRGLKLVTSTPVVNKMISGFGAQGIAAPTDQLFDLISKGVVDGSVFANTGPNASRTEGLFKHQLIIPGSLFFTGFYIVMNDRKWNALSPADQQAVASVSGEKLVTLAGQVFSRLDKADLDARLAAGKTSVATADATFMGALSGPAKAVEAEWVAEVQKLGVDGAAALADLRRQAAALDKPS
jgi:TRAP-type C4-dicarboxylate transport system substrate-binding protein